MWSNPNESSSNQSSHRSLRSLKKTSSPPLGASTASVPVYHPTHQSVSHAYSDVPKRVYHKPPLTHFRSSPLQSSSSPTHRNISVSPVSSCDSPTLVRHFSAEDSNHTIRRIRLIKSTDDDPSAGITLCGGPDVGLQGIYISRVQEDSLAEKCGLRAGDQILSTNYTSFLDGITCKQALRIVCENDCLLFNICPRHEALSHQRRHHCYAWIDPDGRPTSPPPPDRPLIGDPLLLDRQMNPLNTSPFRRKSHCNAINDIRQVTVNMEKGISLGLMIRGGIEYGLGVYVTGIDANSLAEKAGLKVGDQIFAVNNYDFRDVLHDEAVDILKSSPRLTMKVKFVGKVPASCCAQLVKDYDFSEHQTHNLAHIPSSRCSMRRSRHSPQSRRASPSGGQRSTPTLLITDNDCSEEEILEEETQKYLKENDRITLAYYKNEYETKAMTIDAFAALLLELLDTPEKYSLINRIRVIIRDDDLDKFDELVYKREEQAMLKSKTTPEALKFKQFKQQDSSESSFDIPDPDTNDTTLNHNEVNDENNVNHLNEKSITRYLPVLHDRSVAGGPVDHNSEENGPEANDSNFNERLSRSDNLMSHQSVNTSAAYRRAMMLRRHSSSASEAPLMDTTNGTNYATPDERRWSIAAHEVPHDYQHVETNYDNYGGDGRSRSPVGGNMLMGPGGATGDIRGSGNHLHVPGDTGAHPALLNIHSRVRRHRSLPSPTFSNPKALPPPQQHRSSSFRLPSHRAIREQNGQWRVSVKKSKPILGIAIEGGTNVPTQTQPRIISIHSSGAAIECGDLHVGHIILEVDGRSTANMTHDQVAQMVAHAYYNTPHKDFIEFLNTILPEFWADIIEKSLENKKDTIKYCSNSGKKIDEYGGQSGNDEQTEEVVVTEEKIVGDDGVERTIIKKTTTRRSVQTQNITQGARQTTVKRSVFTSDGKQLDEEFHKFAIDGDSKKPIEARKSRTGSTSSSSSDEGFAQKFKSFLKGKPKDKDKEYKKQQSIKDKPENTTEKFVDNRQSTDPTDDDKEFAEECLKRHNYYREKHGVSPLKLSQKLNDYAKEWVQQIAKKDSLQHRPHNTYGENIFMKWSSDPKFKISGRDPVDNWYEEIKVHQFSVEPTSLASGHFTQVVWKASQEMGVAKAKTSTGKIIVVANYSPAGNIIGYFSENVPKPKIK